MYMYAVILWSCWNCFYAKKVKSPLPKSSIQTDVVMPQVCCPKPPNWKHRLIRNIPVNLYLFVVSGPGIDMSAPRVHKSSDILDLRNINPMEIDRCSWQLSQLSLKGRLKKNLTTVYLHGLDNHWLPTL